MADAPAAASASAAEPFSIRGFAARMRSVDAAKCHPFGGGCRDGEEEPLPPMEPPPRSRWWAHELAAVRARLSVRDRGGDAAAGGGRGGVLRKGTKRKGSRSSAAAERANKRRRVLQFRSLLKNKEKTSKPPSTSRLHQHMLRMGSRRELALMNELEEARDHLLPRENIGRMDPSNDLHSSLSRRKEADSFVNERSIKVSGAINYPVNTGCEVVRHATGAKDDIFGDLPLLESSKVILQTGGEELPTVIEESFITDQSDHDAEPEAVSLKLINAFDVTAQTSPFDDLVEIEGTPDKEPICIPCNDTARSYASSAGINSLLNRKSTSMAKTHGDMHLKYSDGPALSSCTDLRSKCSSNNPPLGCFDTKTNCSQGINKPGTSSATPLSVMRTRTEATDCEDALVIVKKSTNVLSPVVATNNLLWCQGNVLPYAVSQGVIDPRTTKNHLSSQGSVLPTAVSHARAYANEMSSCRSLPASTSSASSPQAVRTRTEPTNYKDVPVIFKKRTDISDPFVSSENHFSYHGSVWPSAVSQGMVNTRTIKNNHSCKSIALPSAVSQGVFNTRTDADEMISCRSMPAKKCIPTSRSSGNVTSNVCHGSRKPLDTCVALSTQKQDSWYSKVHPTNSPASIGLAFMKLPGLERMEISSCNVKTGENNKVMHEQSLNTVRCQKQQLVSSMAKVMQGKNNIGLCHSQTGKTVLDGCVGQDVPRQQQPTMRLMGKTVSVCKRSKDHGASNMGKVCSDNITTEATPLTTIPCQFPQKRSFPCQDFAIPRSHLNDSSDFVARIPSNTLSGQKISFNGVHNQSLQPIDSLSSTAKDCTWNFGSQFVRQSERSKASMVSASSETRHVELHQPPHMASIRRNQQSQFGTPASCRSGDDHNFVGPARNQSSPTPPGLLKSSMKEKYKKPTLLCYDDPSSAPISQPYKISGTKLPSASIISFFDYGSNNSLPRYPSSGPCPSRTSLANISVSASGRTYTDSPTNTDGRMGAGFANQINNRPACADNVSQPPAKRQLVTDRNYFTSMGSNMTNHSLGWSLDDAVGPRILDFHNNVAGDAAQIWKTEHNSRVSSGSVPAVETRWRSGLVAEAKTTLKPGQGPNDNSKLLYPATFSVDNVVNSVVL